MLMKFINFQELQEKVKGFMVGLCGWKEPTNQARIPDEDLIERLKKLKKKAFGNPSPCPCLESVLPQRFWKKFRNRVNDSPGSDMGGKRIPKRHSFKLRVWGKV